MCGDFNLDLLNIHSVPFNMNYFDNVLSSGYYIPTITLPARLSDNSTMIDNIFTSNLSSDIFLCILNNHISDYRPIVLFSNDDEHKYITIKSKTVVAKTLFCTSFENKHIMDQLGTNIHNTDPNQKYKILERSLIDTQFECFPDRFVRINIKKIYEYICSCL